MEDYICTYIMISCSYDNIDIGPSTTTLPKPCVSQCEGAEHVPRFRIVTPEIESLYTSFGYLQPWANRETDIHKPGLEPAVKAGKKGT